MPLYLVPTSLGCGLGLYNAILSVHICGVGWVCTKYASILSVHLCGVGWVCTNYASILSVHLCGVGWVCTKPYLVTTSVMWVGFVQNHT